MHSVLIPSELGYPAITLGRITGTPEVRISRSSRTKEILSSMIVRPHQIETDNYVTHRHLTKGPAFLLNSACRHAVRTISYPQLPDSGI